MTPALTPEQMLLVADQFCEVHHVRIRDYGALVAAAAISGARIAGIPVNESPETSGRALADAITRLEPLSARNKEFGVVCRHLYQILHS